MRHSLYTLEETICPNNSESRADTRSLLLDFSQVCTSTLAVLLACILTNYSLELIKPESLGDQKFLIGRANSTSDQDSDEMEGFFKLEHNLESLKLSLSTLPVSLLDINLNRLLSSLRTSSTSCNGVESEI